MELPHTCGGWAVWYQVTLVTISPMSRGPDAASSGLGSAHYSHSMVPGGLLVTSRVTRLTSLTSLVMRVEMRSSTS